MKISLPYGDGACVELELPADALIADCTQAHLPPLDDLAAAMRQTLAAPLDFPALKVCVVPGDSVTLALGVGVPCASTIVAVVIEQLLAAGIEPANIGVLIAADDAFSLANDPRRELPAEIQSQVKLLQHQPSDKGQLAYLAADAAGEPIYLSRALLDADMVIPIGVIRAAETAGDHGPNTLLFPAFSDSASVQRVLNSDLKSLGGPNIKQRAAADDMARRLGVIFVIHVVPGCGEHVLAVLAGEPSVVAARSEQLCRQAWQFDLAQSASLVVAGLPGGAGRQTWENVARALSAAERVVSDHGTILICSELAETPGPTLRRISGAEDLDHALRRLKKEIGGDALIAAELLRVQERAKVYLLSRLEEETVEELGIAHVAAPGDVARLASRHASCIVLGCAQHAAAVLSV